MRFILRFVLLVMLLACIAVNLQAAKLSVRSFSVDVFDMTASTQPRNDRNGVPCAVVVVELPVSGCSFQGNLIGDVAFNGSRYNVYLTDGSKYLQVNCPGVESFRVDLIDGEGNIGVKSKVTYHLYLDGYEALLSNAAQPTAPAGGYLTINVTPKTGFILKINGNMVPTENGEYVKFHTPGKYDILVEATGYEPYSTQVVIDGSGKKNLDVKLESSMATLKISSKTPGTTIKIDGKQRGVDNATLSLAPGQYLVEGEKASHRSNSQVVTLAAKETKTVTVPELTPIYGAIDVNYRPTGATISIDGRQVGTTPDLLSQLLIGNHEVIVTKDGFEPFKTTVKVADGETVAITGSLEEKKEDLPEVSLAELRKKYDFAYDFSEGLVRVKHNYKWGFVDKTGQVVIPIKYEGTGLFSEGLALVKQNGKFGFIDKTDQVVIPFKYDYAGSFSVGLAPVAQNGKYGFIDRTDQVVIPFKYDFARSFSEGLAAVAQNGKWGFIDKTGKIVIPIIYDDAWSFKDGLAKVKQNGEWGFVDKTGQVIIPIIYEDVHEFSEGLAKVEQNGRYGFVDKTGQVVIPIKYDYAGSFSHGLAKVKQNGKWGFVDKTGQVIIPIKYEGAVSFREGLALVEQNGKWGFVDITGQVVIPIQYESAGSFSEGKAYVRLNGQWGYIDKAGNFTPDK